DFALIWKKVNGGIQGTNFREETRNAGQREVAGSRRSAGKFFGWQGRTGGGCWWAGNNDVAVARKRQFNASVTRLSKNFLAGLRSKFSLNFWLVLLWFVCGTCMQLIRILYATYIDLYSTPRKLYATACTT